MIDHNRNVHNSNSFDRVVEVDKSKTVIAVKLQKVHWLEKR